MTVRVLVSFLILLGAVSPLLTFAWLWQLKEWRWDRLKEHLQREGWAVQLWGIIRPLILGAYVIVLMIGWRDGWMVRWVLVGFSLAFAGLTLVQIGLRRQRRPVATKKAITVTGTAFVLTVLLIIELMRSNAHLLPVVIFLQPLTLFAAWLLWYPVDQYLKLLIMRRARRLRESMKDLTVIGITGSVGKTTTKELLACVLQDLHPLTTPAHVNTEMGVANWMLRMLKTSVRTMIVEMGAYRKGEIALLCSFTKPTIGVVTAVDSQHVALFGSKEALFQAKSELVQSLPLLGHAFLNGDNEGCRKMAALAACPVTLVGTGGRHHLEAHDIEETPSGIRFTTVDTLFDVPLHGTHNVTNVLLAIAVGLHMGIKKERMRELLRTFTPLSRTFQIREERGVRILDDTFSSSAASLKAAIAWARVQPEKEKIFLVAGLIEMGEHQSPAERELGGAAGRIFDRMIVLNESSAKNFASGGAQNVEVLSSTSEKVPPGSLLICAGRMSPETIRKLLPSS